MFKNNKKPKFGFTIVELLVVIVVIGILAALSIVSYVGINERAIAARIKSDLSNNSKILELYKVEHDEYPGSLDSNNCPATPEVDDKYCLKTSDEDDSLTYVGGGDDYTLTITNDDSDIAYKIVPGGIPTAVEASMPTKTFAVAWGGTGTDSAKSIIQTSDGGYVVTGSTNSYTAGGFDMFIAKFDSTGVRTWDKTWGGTGSDSGASVVQTSDGGYAVTGSTTSFTAGGKDMFIAKYSSTGGLSWDKTWGGTGDDDGRSIVQTSDGGYAVTGYTVSFNSNMFIAKYDSTGNVAWDRTWGGFEIDYGNSIVQTGDGGYAVTGNTLSYGALGEDYNMFIVKYDSSGSVTWDQTWGGTESDYGNSIIQTSDGGYAVVGEYNKFPDQYSQMSIVKYDSTGNVSWNKTWGASDRNIAKSIVQTSDGGYAVAGNNYIYDYGNIEGYLFVVKYDTLGNLSWDRTLGTQDMDDSGEDGNSIVQTSDGGYVVGGVTNSYGAGLSDVFIAKYDSAGDMSGCSALVCKSPNANTASPTVGVVSPTASVSDPTASVSDPTASVSTPSATTTVVVPVN